MNSCRFSQQTCYVSWEAKGWSVSSGLAHLHFCFCALSGLPVKFCCLRCTFLKLISSDFDCKFIVTTLNTYVHIRLIQLHVA